MQKCALSLFIAVAAVVIPLSSAASTIKILTSVKASSISGADADDDLNAYYNGLGAISSLHTGALTSIDLDGVDLLVIMLPDDAFAPSELTAIGDFVGTGGELLLMGEQEAFASAENARLNALLTSLGSAMSIDMFSFDSGFNDATGMQIVSQAGLTDNLILINYGNVNSISGVETSREMFLAANLSSVWGGYELIGESRVFLLTDVNVLSNLEDTAGNDNHIFFANLLDIQTENTGVKILTSSLAGTIVAADADNDLNSFYQEKGISSSLWPNEVTSTTLAGASLLVVMTPDDAFTGTEITAMGDFLDAGGRILFMGEQDGFAATENGYINSALAALGSSMSLGTDTIDAVGLVDTIPGQILAHPFNSGVTLLNYGNVNSVSGVPAGGGLDGELFLAQNVAEVWGGVDDLASGGSIVLVADLNLLSLIEDEAGNDNHIFFLNIAPGPASAVPGLGSALPLLVLVLAIVGTRRLAKL